MDVDDALRCLDLLNEKIPTDIVENEIFKRIHEYQMKRVLWDIQSCVIEKASEKVVELCNYLQSLYLTNSVEQYDDVRYDICYYDAIASQSQEDHHLACKYYIDHWNEDDNDYFSIYEDFPDLLPDFSDEDEFDY